MTVGQLVKELSKLPATAEARLLFEVDVETQGEIETEEVDAPVGEVHWEAEENVAYIEEGE